MVWGFKPHRKDASDIFMGSVRIRGQSQDFVLIDGLEFGSQEKVEQQVLWNGSQVPPRPLCLWPLAALTGPLACMPGGLWLPVPNLHFLGSLWISLCTKRVKASVKREEAHFHTLVVPIIQQSPVFVRSQAEPF